MGYNNNFITVSWEYKPRFLFRSVATPDKIDALRESAAEVSEEAEQARDVSQALDAPEMPPQVPVPLLPPFSEEEVLLLDPIVSWLNSLLKLESAKIKMRI